MCDFIIYQTKASSVLHATCPFRYLSRCGGKVKLSAKMISWFCGYMCSLQGGKAWVFSVGRRLPTVVWRFIRQPTAPRRGHRTIFSWSMKDTIMVVSVFVVTLGTGCLIIWTSPLQIQAAKVVSLSELSNVQLATFSQLPQCKIILWIMG